MLDCMFDYIEYRIMIYNELLRQKEWWSKCNEILSRDHYICRDCGSIGFHNGGNYMKINNFLEMDVFFKEWRFEGKRFSEYINNIPSSTPYEASNIIAKEESSENGIKIYILSLFQSKCKLFHSIYDLPARIVLVSNKEIAATDAEVYDLGNNFKHINSANRYGWGYIIQFNENISDNIYVNVEYAMPFIIGNSPHEVNIVNITYKNKLILLRFSKHSLQLRGLNIHHTYYTEGVKPWEYTNDSLVTLCEHCHKKRHETSKVPVYNKANALIGNAEICDRCGGSGYLPQYLHVEHGICFKCGGEGVVIPWDQGALNE